MDTCLCGKRVIVFCDHPTLAEAIGLSLRHQLHVEIVRDAADPSVTGGGVDRPSGPDLIVLATSSPDSEPVLALAQASLGAKIGVIPLLITSYRPFDADTQHCGAKFASGRWSRLSLTIGAACLDQALPNRGACFTVRQRACTARRCQDPYERHGPRMGRGREPFLRRDP